MFANERIIFLGVIENIPMKKLALVAGEADHEPPRRSILWE
jgi:hypothetical protein